MSKARIAWSVMVLFIVASGSARAGSLRLYTFSEPPYMSVESDPVLGKRVTGLTIDTVTCAIAAVGAEATIEVVPQPRGLHYLARGEIDGYFAVDPSVALSNLAHPTDPIALEKWHIVMRADEKEGADPRLGVISGSNEEAWLQARGRQAYITVRSPQQLIDLLHRNRIDQVLMDHLVLDTVSGTEGLASQFLRYVPLHAYLSRSFVERNPEFIAAFNRNIPSCMNESFELDPTEEAQVRAIAYDLFQEIETRVPLLDAIESGLKIQNLSEILNLDNQWRALAPEKHSSIAQQVAAAPASKTLLDWQKEKQGLVTEVMLTNSLGTLVAMSQLTSDFWQGDEPKFEQHIRSENHDLHVSPIHYDASTARFQVTVSLPLHAEGRWIPAGVLIVGLDVEKALMSDNHPLYLHDASIY